MSIDYAVAMEMQRICTGDTRELTRGQIAGEVLELKDLPKAFSQEAIDECVAFYNELVNDDTKKMYDVEVHAYNLEENRDSEEFVYVIVNKSSSMEAPIARLVSEPLDPELAAQLLEKLDRKLHPEKYETSDEITVGESDIEEGQTEGEE
jgi:hypothetical protein